MSDNTVTSYLSGNSLETITKLSRSYHEAILNLKKPQISLFSSFIVHHLVTLRYTLNKHKDYLLYGSNWKGFELFSGIEDSNLLRRGKNKLNGLGSESLEKENNLIFAGKYSLKKTAFL